MATRASAHAFVTTFKYPALAPVSFPSFLSNTDWDSFEARLFRYAHYSHYYHNTVFTKLQLYAQQQKKERGLYRYTRPIYNPVYRLVELHVAKAYGGVIDWKEFRTGALPITDADDRLLDAIRQLAQWSNLGEFKTVYARYGVRLGDVAIKVVDDFEREQVRLEFYHPALIKHVETDAVGYVQRVEIEYERQDEDDARPWVYTEIIDKDHFETRRDGELYAVYTDRAGRPVAEWENEYGFVPLTLAGAIHIGHTFRATPFHAALSKIDEVNDLASMTIDQIRKTINPVWWMAGVTNLRQLKDDVLGSTTDEDDQTPREDIPAVLAPAGSEPKAMIANLDVSGAIENIRMILDELEQDMPELSLHRMRQHDLDSAPAAMMVYDDAAERIQEVRGNLDMPLQRALQMGISIGAFNRYEAFRAFSLDSYKAGLLDFQIGDRPIIRDTLDRRGRIELLIQSQAPERLIWQELDVADEDILRAETERLNQQRQSATDVARLLTLLRSGNGGNGAEAQEDETL